MLRYHFNRSIIAPFSGFGQSPANSWRACDSPSHLDPPNGADKVSWATKFLLALKSKYFTREKCAEGRDEASAVNPTTRKCVILSCHSQRQRETKSRAKNIFRLGFSSALSHPLCSPHVRKTSTASCAEKKESSAFATFCHLFLAKSSGPALERPQDASRHEGMLEYFSVRPLFFPSF